MIHKIVIQRPSGSESLILASAGSSFATRSGDLDPLQRGEGALVARGEPALELFERERVWRVADITERVLEIFDQREAEGLVRDSPGDDVVELAAAPRQFLSGAYPALRGRRKRPQELCKCLFVVAEGLGHRYQDGSAAGFLPSKISRSFERQREMRLAMVPDGISSVSPIVW